MAQEYPSELLLTVSTIQHRVPRRTLVEHVHRFNPFESPLRSMEGAETLHRPPPPSDEAVVLFDSPFAND